MWPDLSDLDRTFLAIDAFRQRMGRVLAELDDGVGPGRASPAGHPITIEDKGDALVVQADVPGIPVAALDIQLHHDVLTVRGERTVKPPDGYAVHRQERPQLRFARSVTLPAAVDPEKVVATTRHGVLTITLAKESKARPRQITVKAS